jgi:glycine cleavage system H protein
MATPYYAYQRAQFNTRLPIDRSYTKAHFWIAPQDDGFSHIGFTSFASRMLGEVVEFEFEVPEGSSVEAGQAIGWIEGFKAVSELYAPLSGRFAGPNPELEENITFVHRFPYHRGWIYRMEGPTPNDAMSPEEYGAFLDGTIDRMMGKTS